MKKIYVKLIYSSLIFINLAIIILSILNMPKLQIVKIINKTEVAVLIMALQIIAIVLGIFYNKNVERNIFNVSKKAFLQRFNVEETRTQMTRRHLRDSLNIVTVVAVLLILYFVYMSSKYVEFIIGMCLLTIAYMYADYLPSVKEYGEYCDSLTLQKDERPRAIRGLAKIYKEEYEQTKFNYKSDTYKKVCFFEQENNNVHQDECIKCVLRMKVDYINTPSTIYLLVVTFCSMALCVPDLIDKTLLSITKNADTIAILILILNMLFFYISIKSLFSCSKNCDQIKKIGDAYSSYNASDRYEIYKSILENDTNGNVIHARGCFVYSSALIDKGVSLTNIPLNCKMLFVHRYTANKPRYIITVVLALSALILSLLTIGIQPKIIGFIALTFFVLATFFYFWGLKNLNKRRIIKEIQKL